MMARSLMACIALLSLTATGCAVAGKSFSMDSVSRMPFFGLSLQPRGPDKSDSIHRSISRNPATPVAAATADLRTPPSTARSGWWLGRPRVTTDQALPMQSVPLPRTDVSRLMEDPSSPAVEAQQDSSGVQF